MATGESTALAIGIVGLAIGILVGVALCGFIILFCCLWNNSRKELKILQRRWDYESAVGKKTNQQVHHQELHEFIAEPPPATYNPNHSPPSHLPPRQQNTSSNYSAVNNLSILPDELRTPDNLEAGSVPKARAEQLLKGYLQQRQDYEEAQVNVASKQTKEEHLPTQPAGPLDATSKPESVTPTNIAVMPLSAAPGYEDIALAGYEQVQLATQSPHSVPDSKPDCGDYGNPADSLPEDFLKDQKVKLSGVVSLNSSSQKKQKTFVLSTSTDEYTEVFDNLPSGEVGVVGLPRVRAMSESRKRIQESLVESPNPGVVQNGWKENHGARPESSLENVPTFGDRTDVLRQSKRDSSKEVVELDFSKRKFRVASSKQDSKKLPDGTDGDEMKKKFEASDSYALVNMVDKQKCRPESDDIKKEGSGIPRHYGPTNGHMEA